MTNGVTPQQHDAWTAALHYGAALGDVSRVFTLAIKELRSVSRSGARATKETQPYTTRLLGTPTLRGKLFLAAETFYPERSKPETHLAEFDPFEVFSPAEIAAVITTVVLYRKTRDLVPAQESGPFLRRLADLATVGMHLGMSIPSLGGGDGMLLGALRPAAFAIMSHAQPEEFRRYVALLRERRSQYDQAYERKRWECTHVHIGSVILQKLFHGVEYARDYHLGLSEAPEGEVIGQAKLFRTAALWIDALLYDVDGPDGDVEDEYTLEHEQRLLSRVTEVKRRGTTPLWIERVHEIDSRSSTDERS
jgi:hypothetical protein